MKVTAPVGAPSGTRVGAAGFVPGLRTSRAAGPTVSTVPVPKGWSV